MLPAPAEAKGLGGQRPNPPRPPAAPKTSSPPIVLEAVNESGDAETGVAVPGAPPSKGINNGTRINGTRATPVRADVVCTGADEVNADYSNSEDSTTVVDTDPVTGLQTSRVVVVRRWIRVVVDCGGTLYVQRRCTFGDCPVGTALGIDTPPDIGVLLDQARETASYEKPKALFSPQIKPGKAPVPGLPFFFAVSEAQWNRVVISNSQACNGVACAEAHLRATVVGLLFDPGEDGVTVFCDSAGVIVRSESEFRSTSQACSYTYRTAGTHHGALTLMYDVVLWGGPPARGPYTERVNVVQRINIPVSEFQPVIIR